ncbi:autoinducer 2-degrading protein LsrG [mine drainage metagenome]|uniref:Autoinducer 2-degrading protein LsrG n=1 Tax=mine drainage metagenome TaxID=410659 RepID=A0A1J5S6Z1_9ZZZZ
MQIVIVQVQVKPSLIAAFVAATEANAAASRLEPGIVRFDVLRQSDDPHRFVLVEVYRSPEAIAAHKETAHYRTWREVAEPMMAAPRTRAEYTNVSPSDDRW